MKLGSSGDVAVMNAPAHQPFMLRQARYERLVLLNFIVPMLQRCLLGKQRWSATAIKLMKNH